MTLSNLTVKGPGDTQLLFAPNCHFLVLNFKGKSIWSFIFNLNSPLNQPEGVMSCSAGTRLEMYLYQNPVLESFVNLRVLGLWLGKGVNFYCNPNMSFTPEGTIWVLQACLYHFEFSVFLKKEWIYLPEITFTLEQ